jgi:hypothetical protein
LEKKVMYGTCACQLASVACAVICIALIGCVNSLRDTIPAQSLSPELQDPSRDDLVPIDFTFLGQCSPPAHVIGPDDILGIYIHGVLGKGQEIELETHFPSRFGANDYGKYGPSDSGNFDSPAVGSPTTVMADGTIALPHVPNILVAGLTLTEAAEKIREIYNTTQQLLQPGRDVIKVTVIKPRSIQVLVLREDSINFWPIFKLNSATLAAKRGSGRTIDLPVYQNDVLHALTQSGGLPGSDAGDEIWVLHCPQKGHPEAVDATLGNENNPTNFAMGDPAAFQSRIIKIPLKVLPGQSLSFAPPDVILEAGDVVFIPARGRDHYFVGGMLRGQQVYLPRDYELDVVAAIAMACGSPAGPPGPPLFSKSPGTILPPTRVLILRKVPGGGQVTIHVDLKKALDDRKERIQIRPGDVILLQFTPCEIAGNVLLNAFRIYPRVTRGYYSGTNVSPGNLFTGPGRPP